MPKFNGLNGKVRIIKFSLLNLLLLSVICETPLAQSKPVPTTQTTQSQKRPPSNPQILKDESEPEESSEEKTEDPDTIKADENPLNPAGDSLDRLIQLRINDDLWKGMLGDLPCLDMSDACIQQLQQKAIETSPELKAIDERVKVIEQKVDEAKRNNIKTVQLGVFEPLVQSWLKVEDVPTVPGQPARKKGILNRIGDLFFGNTLSSVNEILSLVGVPLFRNATGGDAAAQSRAIAIGDLQVKLAEIQNKRGEIAAKLRENVILQVLDFDQTRREFQISQEIARRQALQHKLIELDYRLGNGETTQFLGNLSALDKQKAQTFREWARLRSQMMRIKLIVLGAGEN
ncbi:MULTISPECIES: hypothetical protein [Leptolyngbya]|nr:MULTISPECIES: hypothetical protein [Leptolyngbya]MBD2371370.1 hypothetical protein [Leptolyngbya sp. FACHB-161]MBD2377874.1 hypothetical protein [Leptolyngbya sp. FACHB-238]MBD2402313.1 hypothetical protein [Leptolyngbya sp. FACHB-239]MBD2408805.1 hypothetical protein [Leptolyngbya sp. FACHB-402]ULP28145.1 hypothetical protein MCP04_19300 [Leptolyngbya boryana IU 594]